MSVSFNRPRVFFRGGLWRYCDFAAPTIPELIVLVRLANLAAIDKQRHIFENNAE